ncbi:5-amino-6-(5-phosphoribosylamino)uracil reductase [Bradyrhizobium sp. CCBAU 11430]|uniref:dihydrofolate reductase family protein n=1 Tax=unclassified Bradyrhizobium TaxID=2631580 RepID=UPI002306D0A6|nr:MULTISPECIES: dihydrofolate reductase family protein [unclassified Bradyrhizobium]MDA9413837.1 5-amino-6-(5-phosphoribosylamino)uracil reductase [Bradyrhizobium sp. CCBAU 25360]MDA9516751.1 5-amino-6-(5-phosphoribosylamino)uracil reductase [Bradyrhizobium sp. CCBAU 11430]
MKPYVVCHMMGPLDGQLLVEQWTPSTGQPYDALIAEYDRVHEQFGADAWISGRAVGAEFADGKPHSPIPIPSVERPVHVARSGADEYAVLIDPHGKLHWSGPKTYGAATIVLLGRDVPDAHLAELSSDGISYVTAASDKIDLVHALETLNTKFGIKRLILEGGAHTNAEFLEAGLVDEISLLLFPAICGRTSSRTIFGARPDGLADRLRLSMISSEVRQAGVMHLRYKVDYASKNKGG